MIFAGVAWEIYSLRGRRVGDPLPVTTSNFLWAVVPGLLMLVLRPISAKAV